LKTDEMRNSMQSTTVKLRSLQNAIGEADAELGGA
jgi:hypothetical protein